MNLEDSLTNKLKVKAANKGVSVDNYIIYILNRQEADEEIGDNIESQLKTMQLKGHKVPASETGKGALADTKYAII
ncbi:MAG: hypothetical protein II626_06170 [Prevotella sp.]|nr:hypothetical protein [Prevotella sp.]